MLKKLNLGCGTDIKKGWVNLDIYPLNGVDIVHNLTKVPYPFKSEEFDYILCKDILEHLDCVPTMRELHRMLKRNGVLRIRVPHFTSTHNYEDPTHKKMFATRLFLFFVKNSEMGRDYYFDFHFRRVNRTKITFEKGFMIWNYIIEPLVNMGNKTRTIYEFTFLSRLFPADNIDIVMVK